MADQEIIKHVKSAIDTSRDHNKKWPEKLREILLEIVIIVFAVSLSIWLHNWSESRKDRDEEREFLVGLKQDVMADVKEMEGDRAAYALVLQGIHYYERVGAGDKANADSVDGYSWIFGDETQIYPRISRFEALKGSGKMSIIENKALLLHITELYEKDFPLIVAVNNDINALKHNLLLPFFAEHLQLDAHGKGTNWEQLLKLSQMRIIIHTQEAAKNNIDDYAAGIADSKRIIAEIDKEVR
jgi:hypothetical protein